MDYDYIKRAYGAQFYPGDKVRHTVTNHFGEVKRPKISHLHYVRVHFGLTGLTLCHPSELEIVARSDERSKRLENTEQS